MKNDKAEKEQIKIEKNRRIKVRIVLFGFWVEKRREKMERIKKSAPKRIKGVAPGHRQILRIHFSGNSQMLKKLVFKRF